MKPGDGPLAVGRRATVGGESVSCRRSLRASAKTIAELLGPDDEQVECLVERGGDVQIRSSDHDRRLGIARGGSLERQVDEFESSPWHPLKSSTYRVALELGAVDHAAMTEPSGFMGAPVGAQTTVREFLREPEDGPSWDWTYKLPDEVMEPVSFTGTPSDLHYAIKEPTLDQLRKMMTSDTRPLDVVSDYIRAIGRPGPDGQPIPIGDGRVEMMLVTHVEASRWLARVGTIAFGLVTTEWMQCFTPKQSSGEALRGSRRRG